MQPKTYSSLFKSFFITVAAIFSLGTASLQAGQFTYTTPVNSSGNNFSMVAGGGGVAIGGTNDVKFTWDGTLNDAVAGAVSNATFTSDEAFFGSIWNAHDVMMYGPGDYTIFDDCPAGDPGCEAGNAVPFTVGPNQIGAHMLFDWPSGSDPNNPALEDNLNIDVIVVWDFNNTWSALYAPGPPNNPFFAGSDNGTSCTDVSFIPPGAPPVPPCIVDGLPNTDATQFNLISTDVNNDTVAGHPMTDGAFAGSYANFNINGINFPPVAADDNAGTTPATPVIVTVVANDSDVEDGTPPPAPPAVVNITVAPDPADGSVVNNDDGTVTYTSTAGFLGIDTFKYTLTDSDGAVSSEATVSVTVSAVANNPPVANDVDFNTDEDIELVINITDTDDNGVPVATDDDADPLTYATFDDLSTEGGAVTANAGNTELTYMPALNFNGTDSFNFTVNDGIADSNQATMTITVNPVNDPPVCGDVGLNTDINTPLPIDIDNDLLSNCTDVEDDPISLESFTQPIQAGSSVTDDGAGTLTYTPADGFGGEDSFTYTATDGMDAALPGTVTVGVGKVFGNFTMLDAGGTTFGGTNDVASTWDGTLNTAVTDTNFNVTMKSDSDFPFFGFVWNAHDIRMFGPGTYMFDTTCSTQQVQQGLADCGGAPDDFLTLTIGDDQIGAHMLFDWNVTANIDVVNLYQADAIFPSASDAGALYQGPAGPTPDVNCEFEQASIDGDGDGVPGVRFIDGPFIGFRANFNQNFNQNCGVSAPIEPVKSSISSSHNGGGCTLSAATVNPLSRGDYWLMLGFIGLLGAFMTRRRI